MAKKTAKKNAGKVIGYISYAIVLCLLIGLLVFFGYFTNWFSSDFKTFYLKVNDETVMDDVSELRLTSNQTLKIDVIYPFAFFDKSQTGYSFAIKANPNLDINFDVDGETISFQNADIDWNKCFDIAQGENSLAICAKAAKVSDFLKLAIGKDVHIDSEYFDADLFYIEILSYDQKHSITLGLHFYRDIEGVSLDKEEIVF